MKNVTATINTILSVVFIDIANPKVGYFVYHNNSFCRIKFIKNKHITLANVIYPQDIINTDIDSIKDKYIKFLSIHSKVTHSINHTSNNKIVSLLKSTASIMDITVDSLIDKIINNTVKVDIVGKVEPVYVYPSIGTEVVITSKTVMENFKLESESDRICFLKDIYRNNKFTAYTLKTKANNTIMADRSDFKLLYKPDRKDLFSIL